MGYYTGLYSQAIDSHRQPQRVENPGFADEYDDMVCTYSNKSNFMGELGVNS